jgi:hypothetical protein
MDHRKLPNHARMTSSSINSSSTFSLPNLIATSMTGSSSSSSTSTSNCNNNNNNNRRSNSLCSNNEGKKIDYCEQRNDVKQQQPFSTTNKLYASNSYNKISNNNGNNLTNKAKNNLSATTTTLEISSFTSDSLYNSHLFVTPICSEAMSPRQFGGMVNNYLIKSPLNHHNQSHQQVSPSVAGLSFLQTTQMYSNSSCGGGIGASNLPNSSSILQTTPKSSKAEMAANATFFNTSDLNNELSKVNYKSGLSPSPPPPPSPIVATSTAVSTSYLNQIKQKNLASKQPANNNQIFPSPPSLKTAIGQSSPSDAFPSPPIFLDTNNNRISTDNHIVGNDLEISQISMIEKKNNKLNKNGESKLKQQSANIKGLNNQIVNEDKQPVPTQILTKSLIGEKKLLKYSENIFNLFIFYKKKKLFKKN